MAEEQAMQGVPGEGKKKRKRLTKKQKMRQGLIAKPVSAVAKYKRGEQVATKRISDLKVRGEMGRSEYLAQEAAVRYARGVRENAPRTPGSCGHEGEPRGARVARGKRSRGVEGAAIQPEPRSGCKGGRPFRRMG